MNKNSKDTATTYDERSNNKEIVKDLPENHDTTDRVNAMKYAFAPEGLYTGIFYKDNRPTYEERYQEIIKKAKQKKEKKNERT